MDIQQHCDSSKDYQVGVPSRVLGVIIARGGSVGLPEKHLLPLAGKPVLTHTLEHLRTCRQLTHKVVSSDCPRVLALADKERYETLVRPPELATSEASVQDVLLHAMDAMEAKLGLRFDAVVTVYGNVPVRPEGAIDSAVELLLTSGCDSVRSFTPVGKWHPQWMAQLREGRVIPLHPGSLHRRQDLTPLFLHDGAVVVSSRDIMERARKHRGDPHAFFGFDRRAIETPAGSTIEIDHKRDLYWAEAALREQAESRAAESRATGLRVAG